MSNYQKGAAKERTTINKLIDMGCSYACRVAGSHSEFDVIGSYEQYTVYVQVKSTLNMPKKILSVLKKYSKDWIAMYNVHLTPTSLKELWIYKSRARVPTKIGIVDVQFYTRI